MVVHSHTQPCRKTTQVRSFPPGLQTLAPKWHGLVKDRQLDSRPREGPIVGVQL